MFAFLVLRATRRPKPPSHAVTSAALAAQVASFRAAVTAASSSAAAERASLREAITALDARISAGEGTVDTSAAADAAARADGLTAAAAAAADERAAVLQGRVADLQEALREAQEASVAARGDVRAAQRQEAATRGDLVAMARRMERADSVRDELERARLDVQRLEAAAGAAEKGRVEASAALEEARGDLKVAAAVQKQLVAQLEKTGSPFRTPKAILSGLGKLADGAGLEEDEDGGGGIGGIGGVLLDRQRSKGKARGDGSRYADYDIGDPDGPPRLRGAGSTRESGTDLEARRRSPSEQAFNWPDNALNNGPEDAPPPPTGDDLGIPADGGFGIVAEQVLEDVAESAASYPDAVGEQGERKTLVQSDGAPTPGASPASASSVSDDSDVSSGPSSSLDASNVFSFSREEFSTEPRQPRSSSQEGRAVPADREKKDVSSGSPSENLNTGDGGPAGAMMTPSANGAVEKLEGDIDSAAEFEGGDTTGSEPEASAEPDELVDTGSNVPLVESPVQDGRQEVEVVTSSADYLTSFSADIAPADASESDVTPVSTDSSLDYSNGVTETAPVHALSKEDIVGPGAREGEDAIADRRTVDATDVDSGEDVNATDGFPTPSAEVSSVPIAVDAEEEPVYPDVAIVEGNGPADAEDPSSQPSVGMNDVESDPSPSDNATSAAVLVSEAKKLVASVRRKAMTVNESDKVFSSAVEKLRTALDLSNGASNVLAQYGVTLLTWAKCDLKGAAARDRLEESSRALALALEKCPNDEMSLFNRGLCICLIAAAHESDNPQGLYQEACRMYDKLLELNKSSRVAAFNCGLAYVSCARLCGAAEPGSEEVLEYYEQAEDRFRRTLALEPTDQKAAGYLEECVLAVRRAKAASNRFA